MRWSPSGFMANARWSSLTVCSALTSWQIGSARLSAARTTNICPLPKMLPDHALGRGNVAEVTTRPYVLMVFTDDQTPFGILSRLPFVREFFVENGLELAPIGE